MGFLKTKKALITGVASNRSIAWGIAEAMHKQGCELAFTYQNDKLKKRVLQCADLCNSNIVIPCDVSDDKHIKSSFKTLQQHWQEIDIIVHAIAYAPREALEGDYLDNTTKDVFLQAHHISSYSFNALARILRPMLSKNAALLTVSYLGAVRAIPNYNIMGVAKASLEANVRYMANALGQQNVRVNAVSAGPIKTLAASGIKDFSTLLNYAAHNSALGRNVSISEVGNVAAFLCSDLASGVTNETVYVDSGYSICDKGPLI